MGELWTAGVTNPRGGVTMVWKESTTAQWLGGFVVLDTDFKSSLKIEAVNVTTSYTYLLKVVVMYGFYP